MPQQLYLALDVKNFGRFLIDRLRINSECIDGEASKSDLASDGVLNAPHLLWL